MNLFKSTSFAEDQQLKLQFIRNLENKYFYLSILFQIFDTFLCIFTVVLKRYNFFNILLITLTKNRDVFNFMVWSLAMIHLENSKKEKLSEVKNFIREKQKNATNRAFDVVIVLLSNDNGRTLLLYR